MFHTLKTQASYETVGLAFDAAVGCAPGAASCLRGLSLAAVLAGQDEAFGQHTAEPVTDTKILPKPLMTAFSKGDFNRVPVLLGTTANEGRFFEPGDVEDIFDLTASTAVTKAGGPANFELGNPNAVCGALDSIPTAICTYAQEVGLFVDFLNPAWDNASFVTLLASLYPTSAFPDPFDGNAPNADEALAQLFTDAVFACNAHDADRDLAKFVAVYAYEFNDPNAPPGNVNGFPSASEHSADLQFLFDEGSTLNSGEQQLATQMKTYWANFVKTLNPNLGSSGPVPPSWPPFNGSKDIQALLPGPQSPKPYLTFPKEHFCSTWQPILEAE
jgi:para-nitrobenzyl esterase